MKLKRPLRGSETGADVRMVQRALNKWAAGKYVDIPVNGRFDYRTSDRLMAFQAEQKIRPASGKFGQASLDKLWPYFDAYGRMRYAAFKPPPEVTKEEIAFERLLDAMKQMDKLSRGYLLGGGHGVPLDTVSYADFLDCSSSTSLALWHAGLFDHDYARVSGQLTSWGEPGSGKFFTLYANSEHVWIRLNRNRWNSRWWRFDTSPHVDGRPSENPRRGPRLRYLPRFTSSFAARHYPGM